jgi:integrase/recombinase XerD
MSVLQHSTLAPTVQRYVAHQRALGKSFGRQAYVLSQLLKFIERAGIADLDATMFDAWSASGRGTSSNARRSAQQIVHRFCRYRQRLEPVCFVPDPLHFARRSPYREPVIFGAPEVARMLRFAALMPGSVHFPMSAAALRLMIILLYTTGMRRGELGHLRLSDLDITAATIRIRDGKFHKMRLIPISSSTCSAVRRYLHVRLLPPWDIAPEAPLFGHQHGCDEFRGYSGTGLYRMLSSALAAARILDADGRPAHVHDFRHSFAVQALLRWYRQGVDVSAKLPQLSMYMGHASIASTAYYLHFIPQIARAASRQFHRQCGLLIGGAS